MHASTRNHIANMLKLAFEEGHDDTARQHIIYVQGLITGLLLEQRATSGETILIEARIQAIQASRIARRKCSIHPGQQSWGA